MHRALHRSRTLGFTLVELSIVLVILGLLVGGILGGQSLIRAAELRAVSTEYSRYTAAIGTFRDKFFGLPGDISDATKFWTAARSGNGDGFILGNPNLGAAAVANTNETHHFWQHLALAALVEGSYTPASWASSTIGTTNPPAKLKPAGWSVRAIGTTNLTATGLATGVVGTGDTTFYEGIYGNAFILMSGTDLSAPSGGVIRAEEAWNIDSKLDDGKPMTGSVVALKNQGAVTPGGCGNNTGNAATAYDLPNTSVTACSLIFKTGY